MDPSRDHSNLLEAALAAPDPRVGKPPLLTPAERHRILVEWNDTRRERLSEPNVARLFEEQAERTPAAIAVVFGGERLTYRELDARSNRLARALCRLGVGPGVLAGICMERSLETAVAVLGILKAGGAYVALDPEYPRERLEFMLEDSRAPVLLTDEESAPRIPRHDAVRVVLGSEPARAMLAAQADTPLAVGAVPEDLAYVIYTSGSTGTPKGVAMPHRALLNLIAWQKEAALNPAAKTLQFASLNFDVSFQEMFSTWCAGGTLVLVSE
ncbi:MAG: AMP-binding protein, partial [Acidobacteriota bacterium]|nr:AMP-binding protein [Acidobacteriota bacterium]